MEKVYEARRGGKPLGLLTLDEISKLIDEGADDLEINDPEAGGWIRPGRFQGDDSEIEVVLG